MSDAVPSACGEWNVAAWMAFSDFFRQEVVGVELIGFLAPNVFLSVKSEYIEDNCHSLWNNLSRFCENRNINTINS